MGRGRVIQVEAISPKILASSFLSFSGRFWNAGSLGDNKKPESSTSSGLLSPLSFIRAEECKFACRYQGSGVPELAGKLEQEHVRESHVLWEAWMVGCPYPSSRL